MIVKSTKLMTKKKYGAIAAGHQKTAEAGMEILKMGGNAFDAPVEGILASFVAEPMLTSLAGGGFLLAHTSNQENILFDFFTQTPKDKKDPSEVDLYPADVNFGDAVQTFHIGFGSMALPANVKGVLEVHQKLGKLPFSVVAEPAILYAENGLEVNDFQAFCLQILRPNIFASPEARKIFAPDGSLNKSGELLVIRDLAATIKNFVSQGSEYFYQNEIAEKIVQDCQNHGG